MQTYISERCLQCFNFDRVPGYFMRGSKFIHLHTYMCMYINMFTYI